MVKLRNNATNQLYKNAIQSAIKHVTIECKDPTTICNEIETIITAAATTTIGIYRVRKQAWIINDILELCDQRRALKSHLKTDPSKKDEYRNLNSNIRKSMKKAKDDWIQDQCASINKVMDNNR